MSAPYGWGPPGPAPQQWYWERNGAAPTHYVHPQVHPRVHPHLPLPGHSKRPMLLTAGVLCGLVVAALLIVGFSTPGFLLTRQLDVQQAQAGVRHVLSDTAGYGAPNVSDVTCNGGQNPTIKKGETFTCEVTIDSVRWEIPVKFTDDAGSYELGRPQ
jgi:hypothetical protein